MLIKNLFKKKDYDSLDIQTLTTVSHSELCQIVLKFNTELKDSVHKLESQSESLKQLKNSNDELSLYKTHSESLQSCIQQMSTENESYKTLIESRNQELKFYKEKVIELEKVAESAKNIPSILAELEIFKTKTKDALEKSSILSTEKENLLKEKANVENSLRLMEKRQEDYMKRVQELENNLKGKAEECLKIKQQTKGVKGKLKESEMQVRELEDVNKGKTQKMLELENQMAKCERGLENEKKKVEEAEKIVEGLKAKLLMEQQSKDSEIIRIQEKLEKDNSEKIENLSRDLIKTIEDYKVKITALEIEKSKNLYEIEKLTQDLSQVHKSLKAAEETLEISQQKRNLAKEELLKLTQKFESTSHERVPIKPVHSFTQPNVSTSSLPEHKAMNIVKSQLDILYKSLMDILLSANATRDSVNSSIVYKIDSESFSKFEKELNKIVMNVHEAAENPSFVEQGVSGRFSNWAPSKLFSCITSERQHDRSSGSNAPEKRRWSYKGFF